MIASLHDTIRKYSVRIKPKTVKITTKRTKKQRRRTKTTKITLRIHRCLQQLTQSIVGYDCSAAT